MKAHVSFYHWVCTLSSPDVSKQGVDFAKAQIAGEHDGLTTLRWLRAHQGKILRALWHALPDDQRHERLNAYTDASFPLGGAPSSILDSLSDPTSYLKRAGGWTQILASEVASSSHASLSDLTPRDKTFNQFVGIHDELTVTVIGATLELKLHVKGVGVRSGDANAVATHAAGVLDGLAGNLTMHFENNERDIILSVINDVAESVSATRTQLSAAMHTDVDVEEATDIVQQHVNNANAALAELHKTAMDANSNFRSAFEIGEKMRGA